ncbi:hypothetical protein BJ165DRAFT_1578135 [Panaeolus papilionaceus]|nr:hypothetical protein BJ165DRAFT_1578135 [Panaeolus papilionaceus]
MALANGQLEILHSPGSSPSSSPPAVHNMLVETNPDIDIPNKPPVNAPTVAPRQDNSVPMMVDTDDVLDLPNAPLGEEDGVWDRLLCQMPLDAWFQVEDIVFSLEISRYITESAYMASLYRNAKEYLEANPKPPCKPGVSKECPITVNGVKKEDMNVFIGALQVNRHKHTLRHTGCRDWGAASAKSKGYSKEEVTQCVVLAQMWELTSIEEQFYHQLGLPDQSPAFRIYAAVKFKDEKLVSISTLRSLVFVPVNEPPNATDLKRLTYAAYRAVTFARDAIMAQRAAIAAHFPTIPKAQRLHRPVPPSLAYSSH